MLQASQICLLFGEEIPISELGSRRILSPAPIAGLPILYAIVIETLRLRDGSPLPRVTPNKPISITGCPLLPPNIRGSSASYVLYHDPHIFLSPREWYPRRRFEDSQVSGAPEKRNEMGRSFIALGSGSRTFIGRNLAMLEMGLVLAAICAN